MKSSSTKVIFMPLSNNSKAIRNEKRFYDHLKTVNKRLAKKYHKNEVGINHENNKTTN